MKKRKFLDFEKSEFRFSSSNHSAINANHLKEKGGRTPVNLIMPKAAIPLLSSLDEVYTPETLILQGARWDRLAKTFRDEYGMPCQKISRAPGRVNVLGEHIDYCGFSVLPAAIERDVLMAFSTSQNPPSSAIDSSSREKAPTIGKTTIILRNLDPKYTPFSFELDLKNDGSEFEMPKKHHWSNYFIAGAKGLLKHVNHSHPEDISATWVPPNYVEVLVTGSVPSGSGLSSSSAMTTAAVVTMLEVTERRTGVSMVARKEITEIAIESERLVGVNSGGMDQAASVFSVPLNLLHVEFVPTLSAKPVPLPETSYPFSFVIANTLVTSDKQVTAKTHYNLRVVETRLGARLLAKHLNLAESTDTIIENPTFRTVLDTYFHSTPPPPGPHPPSEHPPSHLPPTLPTIPALPSSPLTPASAKHAYELKIMLGVAAQFLGGPGREKGETWEEIAERLEESPETVQKEVVGDSEVEAVDGRLKIWTRARHVLSEALRVYQFKSLLLSAAQSSDLSSDPNDEQSIEESKRLLKQMGQLMNDSQTSCQLDYECSCPEIDELVTLARASGAVGSRLTGAGWGGSTVSLVPEGQVSTFIKALQDGYYAKRFPNLTQDELQDACFATKPEAGACLFEFTE